MTKSKYKATGYGKKGSKIYEANDDAGSGHNADILGDVQPKQKKGWL